MTPNPTAPNPHGLEVLLPWHALWPVSVGELCR
jgi:hypothetical protein